MSKLPRTRPQRVTGRRQRYSAPSEANAPPGERKTRRSAGTQRTAAARTPRTSAAATRSSPGPARRAPAPASPPSPAPPPPARSSAPGLPRLAVDGAVEAAKLPLKVGGRLTLRALDAVARSLRGA